MTTRYAYIVNGQTIWGPGPNPYFITLVNGDIWEVLAHTVEESEAIGVYVVEQLNKRSFDERFEQANTPMYVLTDGRPQEVWSYSFVPAARENMKRAIDEHAENIRNQIATNLAGQYAEYDEVYREALEVAALDPNTVINTGDYPYLDADIGVTYSPVLQRLVQTVREAAELVILTREQWKLAGAQIREGRLHAKRDITDAATDAEAYQIYLANVS